MPSSTTPHMPSTGLLSRPSTMWQMEVPMIMSILPTSEMPAAGTDTCASTFPTATGVPARNPVSSAIAGVRFPARVPSGSTLRIIFSSMTCSSLGSSSARNSSLTKPVRLS